MTPYDRACRVQTALEAALGPGGEFDLALDELIVEAQILALDTAGVPISDDGPPEGWDDDHIRERVAWSIAEGFFKVALKYAETHPEGAVTA